METVSIKLEDGFARDMEAAMQRHRYMTKAEFIREAIREKLNTLDEEDLRRLRSTYGASKLKTSDEDLHRVRAQLFGEDYTSSGSRRATTPRNRSK